MKRLQPSERKGDSMIKELSERLDVFKSELKTQKRLTDVRRCDIIRENRNAINYIRAFQFADYDSAFVAYIEHLKNLKLMTETTLKKKETAIKKFISFLNK